MVGVGQQAEAKFIDTGYALGVRCASTMGFGAEFTKRISNKFNARFGYNTFRFGLDGKNSEAEVEYKLDFILSSVTGFVDYHPGWKSFRISSGLVINNGSVNSWMKPTG